MLQNTEQMDISFSVFYKAMCICAIQIQNYKYSITNNWIATQIFVSFSGPALADARPNARPGRGAPLSSDFMTSSCSVNLLRSC